MSAQRLQNRTSSSLPGSTPPGSGVSGGGHGRSTGPACPSPRPPALARLPAVLVASLTLCGLGVADTPLREEAMDEVTAGQFSLDLVLTSQLTQPFLRGGSFLPDYRERLDRVLPPTSVQLPAEPRVPAMPVTPPAGQAPEPSPPAPDTPAKPVPTGGTGVTAVATATGTTFSSSSASSFSGPGGSGGSAKAVACCGSGANVSTGGSAAARGHHLETVDRSGRHCQPDKQDRQGRAPLRAAPFGTASLPARYGHPFRTDQPFTVQPDKLLADLHLWRMRQGRPQYQRS